MSETITLDGSDTDGWEGFEVIDSVSKGAKSFTCVLDNSDGSITDIYESFDSAVIVLEGVTVFNGRIDEIIPNESEGDVEISGHDYIGDLIGEYIIEEYGISQDLQNDESAGSSVVIEIADTTGFEVDDEIRIADDASEETATITAVVTNVSITVDTLSNSYTTAANAAVTVGQLGSFIVDDLVTKYAPSLTRAGIQTSSNKIITLFKGVTALDAIQYIADTEEYEFGQDGTLDFFYQSRTFEDSGLTLDLDTDDILEYKFPRPGYEIINRVDVYGATVGGEQVAARVEDHSSQTYYGVVKGTTIIDENVLTEDQAVARANAVLTEKAWIISTGEIEAFGYESLKAGQLVTLSNFESIADGKYLVTRKMHTYLPGITTISVAEYRTELEDVIVDLVKRMREREKDQIDEDALQTKFMNFYVTNAHSDAIVNVIKVDINDGFIMSHKTNGLVGRGYNGVGGTALKVGRYATETVII